MNKHFEMKRSLIVCIALLIGVVSFGLCLLGGLGNSNFNHSLDVQVGQSASNNQTQIEGESDIPFVGAGETITIRVYYEEKNNGFGGISSAGVVGGTIAIVNDKEQGTQTITLQKTEGIQNIYAFNNDGYELKKVYNSSSFTTDAEETGVKIISVGGIYRIKIENPQSNNLYVYFTLIRYDVEIEYSPENFSVSHSKEGFSYFYDEEVTIICMELNAQYKFYCWQEEDSLGHKTTVSTQKTYKFNIRSTKNFLLVPKVLIQLEQPEIGGNVYIEDGMGAKHISEYYAIFGEELRFVAEASSGYEFFAWTSNELFGYLYDVEITVGGPISTSAQFVSKKCEIIISSTDDVHGDISGSTDTTNRLYNIGEVITLKVDIAPNYQLVGWNTNSSGSLNRAYAGEQNYTITAADVQQHNIYFNAVVKKVKAHASITVFGGGEIKINSGNKTTSLEENVSVGQTYQIDFYPFNMYKITDIKFYDINKATETSLLTPQVLENMQTTITVDDDFELRIKFGKLTWQDNCIEPQGEGTSENPYLITCPEELAFISYAVKNNISQGGSNKVDYNVAYYKIMNNLNLRGNFWELIGDNLHTFQGTIDANFKTINNIQLEDGSTNHNYISLFGGNTRYVKIIRELQTLWRVFFISFSFILLLLIIIIAINMNRRKEKIKKVIILDKELLNKNYK